MGSRLQRSGRRRRYHRRRADRPCRCRRSPHSRWHLCGWSLGLSPLYRGPDFIRSLAADDDRAAYDLLCPSTQETLSFDEFSKLSPHKNP